MNAAELETILPEHWDVACYDGVWTKLSGETVRVIQCYMDADLAIPFLDYIDELDPVPAVKVWIRQRPHL